MLARADGGDWAPVDGKADQDAGTLGGSAYQRSFNIAGLDPGRYKVTVWGAITHPNGDNGPSVVTSSETTSTLNYEPYQREGIIGVGTPGEWWVGGCWGSVLGATRLHCKTCTALPGCQAASILPTEPWFRPLIAADVTVAAGCRQATGHVLSYWL